MKKTIALILSVCITFSCMSIVFAETSGHELVSALGIMVGDRTGNFNNNGYLTREQLAKITVAIADPEYIPVNSVSPYKDVPYHAWSSGYIKRASGLGIFIGFPDGTFRPNEYVNVEQTCKIMLELLGYSNIGASADWANSQVNAANSKGLLEGVSYTVGQPITRINVAKIIQNALCLQKSGSSQYLAEDLECKYYEDMVIITDKGLSNNYILTDKGTFKKGILNSDDILSKGKAVVDKGDRIVWFEKDILQTYVYTLKTALPDNVTVSDDGKTSVTLPVDKSTVVYNGTQTSNWASCFQSLR